MQSVTLTYLPLTIATTLVSFLVGLYLLQSWSRQEVRLYSDLPLVFGITFLSHGLNNLLRALVMDNVLPDSLWVFKIRSLVILGTVLPLMVALLEIWTPQYRRHHPRLIGLMTIYWVGAVFFSASQLTILLLCIPIVLTVTLLLALTFLITWKTRRLREVRSGLMVIALALISIGQITATNPIVNGLCNGLGTVTAAIALTNPWHRSSSRTPVPGEVTSPLVSEFPSEGNLMTTSNDIGGLLHDSSLGTVETLDETVLLSRSGLLRLTLALFSVATLWRLADIFVFDLGSTPINILPSKLFPLLILLATFWFFRRNEVSSILGLSSASLRTHLVVGTAVGIVLYSAGVVVPQALFSLFTSEPLGIGIVNADLLWYGFVFFLTNAIMEETYFRGLLFNTLNLRMNAGRAIVLSSVLFGFWHIVWPIANGFQGTRLLVEMGISVVFSALLGVFFAIYYVYFSAKQSLVGTITAHTLINFLNEFLKVGFPSTMQGPDTPPSNPLLITLTAIIFVGSLAIMSILIWRASLHVAQPQESSSVAVTAPLPTVSSSDSRRVSTVDSSPGHTFRHQHAP